MKAWIASRRLLADSQSLSERWSGLRRPDGASALYVLRNDEDPGEVLELSFWPDAQRLGAYRAALAVGSQSDASATTTTAQSWRSYTVWPAASGRGMWRFWPGLPALAAIAGAAGLLMRARQPQPPIRVARGLRPGRQLWLAVPGLLTLAGTGWLFLRSRLLSGGRTRQAMTSVESMQENSAIQRVIVQDMPAATSDSSSRLLVRDVMTPSPETIDYEADLVTAAARMRDLNVGVLPVLADRQLAGMITDRDIALCLAEGGDTVGNRHVYDVMSEIPVTTRPDATVQEASQAMASHQVRRLPVMDGTELVGILSLGDVAVEQSSTDAGEALQGISEPAEPQR